MLPWRCCADDSIDTMLFGTRWKFRAMFRALAPSRGPRLDRLSGGQLSAFRATAAS